MNENEDLLSICKLTCWHQYKKLTANQINLSVKPDEHTLIYGSSLELQDFYRAVVGLEKPDEGIVQFHGAWCAIPETFPYLEALSMVDYIKLPLKLLGESTCDEAYIRKLTAHVGLCTKEDIAVKYFNAFDRCTLMLIMAAVTSPELLIINNCIKWLSDEEIDKFISYLEYIVQELRCTVLHFSEIKIRTRFYRSIYHLKNSILIKEG